LIKILKNCFDAKDRAIPDAVALTAFVIVESLQFLIILALIYSFIPMHLADFIKDLPLKLQNTIQPKREVFFYRCFLVFALLGQIAAVAWFGHRGKDIPRRALLKVALADMFLILIEVFAVFKIWQYDNPWWARNLLYGSIGVWVLARIFWVECISGMKIIIEAMMEKRKFLKYCVDALVPVLLIACLWVPDVQKALGRVFVWDQFRNWDSLMMLPGWGYLHGQGLNTDIISSWGMGAVIFISRCTRILGGFDYAHVLTLLMGMAIIYYGLLYVFLRAWLRSVLLAASLVAIAVKIQMFHSGITPLIWIFPQDTPVRHWLDLSVLWYLWQHARRGQNKYLLWVASTTGAALAWQFSTGLCLLAAFWGYLIFLLMVHEYRSLMASRFQDVRRVFFYSIMPLAMMVVILFLLQGSAVFQAQFWKNLIEPIKMFLQGVGTLSFYACLYDRHFFAFIAGFVIPVIYAWTLIIIAGLGFSKRALREDLFLVPVCIYGLCLYTHYLAHSSISHYYAVGVPVVMVIGFWLSKMLTRFTQGQILKFCLLLVIGAWGALFTNVFFVYYPNIFDLSRMDWKPEVSVYQSQLYFGQDAAMIARLSPETQGAPVISSFETSLLMQAKRKVFFYYAPLVISQRMDTSGFAGTSLITQERMDKTLGQMARLSPEYIFIEKKLLGQWPPEMAQYYPGIIVVLRYVLEHYQPQEQGMYLIAMRKK